MHFFELDRAENVNLGHSLENHFLQADLYDLLFLEKEELVQYFADYEEKKVLVIEDDLAQFLVLEQLIKEINPKAIVEWESDAKLALSKIESALEPDRRHYDLVISDVALGGEISGVDILRQCEEYKPETKTILISSHSKDDLRRNYFKKSDRMNYLQKPLNFHEFKSRVLPLLG